MRIQIRVLFALALLLLVPPNAHALTEAVSPLSRPLQVTIDPGHGGNDSGAFAAGLKESNLVLAIALKLEKRLIAGSGFQVNLTRREDSKLHLSDRVRKAELAAADVFVSLHANSSTDSRARGMEIYFQNHIPPDEETLILAALENQREMLKESEARPAGLSKKNDVAMIIEDLRRSNRVRSSRRLSLSLSKTWESENPRHVRQAPFHVVTRISIPSVLMELGFLTNRSDREQLQSAEVQDRIVENIYQGLVAFRNESAKLQKQ